jgi:predicted Zn-dependent protease
MYLSPLQLRKLAAAQGYCELGMFADAAGELENIDSDLAHLPLVMNIRLQIYAGMQRWNSMEVLAKGLVESDPDEIQWIISWAYATRRTESISAAKEILLAAVRAFPAEAIVHYNLGCYDAQLGDTVAAMEHLARCFSINAQYRKLALEDEDLKSIWHLIGAEAGDED